MDFESLHVLDAAEARLLYEEVVMQQCYFADGFHVHSGDVVVDCGANIGIFSLLCLARASALTLIALEPIPLTFQTLQMNLRGCAQLLANNVTAIECAVAAEAAETDFLFFPSSPGESCAVLYASEREEQQQRLIEAAAASDVSELFDALMLAQESIAAPTVHTCSSHTLEQILTHLGVAEVDFLKVDVEGGELLALQGLGRFWPLTARIVVEVHDLDGRLAAVTSLLALHGFSVTVRASQSQVSEEGYMTFVPPELRLFLVFATASRLVASTAHNQQSI